MGKSDFDAIESFRDTAFFKRALGIAAVPSSPTLHQRMDTHAESWFELAPKMNQLLLASHINGQAIDFGVLECGYTPVDLDTFDMDNGGTKKSWLGVPMRESTATARLRCTWAVWVTAWSWPCEPVCSTRLLKRSTTWNAHCRWQPLWWPRPCWCGQIRAFVL